MRFYECLDCHKVLKSDQFYWYKARKSSTKNKKYRMVRCKECERVRRSSSVEYHVNEMFNSTRRRCKAKGVEFNLTKAWYRDKLNGQCELSGLPFDFFSKKSNQSARAASVDRIDPKGGYCESNCRMICIAINYLFGPWGEESALGTVLPYLRARGFLISVDDGADE